MFVFFCKELNSLSLDGFEFGMVKPFFWYKNILPKGLRQGAISPQT